MMDKKNIVERYVEEARYTPSCIESFRGNRLIEALPDYLTSSASEMQEYLASSPGGPPLGRSRLVRAMWLIDATPELFVAEGRHIKLFELLDMMIRHGYRCRAPESPEHMKYLSEAYARQQNGEHVIVKYGRPSYSPITTAVIGCSGTGKSMAVEQVLRLYPQLIHHPETENSDPFDQLWST